MIRGEQIGHELAAKSAMISDFLPFPASLIGPATRIVQQGIYGGQKEMQEHLGENVIDIATSLLGPVKGVTKGAASAGYEGIKALAGRFSPLFNTKAARSIEHAALEADKTELAKEFTKKVDADYFNKLLQDLFDGTISDKDALAYAKSIENISPTYAEELTNYVRDKARNWPLKEQTVIDGKLIDNTHGYTIDRSKAGLTTDIFDKQGNLQPQFVLRQVPDKQGSIDTKPVNLVKDQAVISNQHLRDIATYKAPSKAAVIGLKTLKGVSRPTTKFLTGAYFDKSNVKAPSQQDYDKAVDYVIDDYKRMWDAGFVPHNDGSIVYEAYQKYLKDRDND